jgi:hypothetical protein
MIMHTGSHPNEKCLETPKNDNEASLLMLLELPAGEKVTGRNIQ